jgi:flagellar secretion chaperone FliS
MFAQPSPFQPAARHAALSRHPLAAYVQTGVETRIAEADPHALVAMLFDGLFDALIAARGAMLAGDLTAKGRAIGRAVAIVDEGLRAALDLKAGGTLARDLHDLYAYVTMRLTRANLNNDLQVLAECAALLAPLREAWKAIRPAQPAQPN